MDEHHGRHRWREAATTSLEHVGITVLVAVLTYLFVRLGDLTRRLEKLEKQLRQPPPPRSEPHHYRSSPMPVAPTTLLPICGSLLKL